MSDTFLIARFNDANVYSLVVDKEGQTLKELLLVLIKCLTKRFKVGKVEAVDNTTMQPFANSFFVFL